jgi:cytochrome c553
MKHLVIVLFLFFGLNANSFSQDAAKGQKLYKKCIACHGKMGEGKKSQKAPRLAGQYDWYIVSSLKAFKSKVRKNPKMLPFIKRLSPQDFKDLAAYISGLK